MEEQGRHLGDGIGEIYRDLYELLNKNSKEKIRRRRIKELNPNKYFSKGSLRFMHDLIYFCGPIYFNELQRILRILFKNCTDKSLQKHTALLCAICEIVRDEKGLYKSLQKNPYLEYDDFDINEMISSFKNMYFRSDSSRLL